MKKLFISFLIVVISWSCSKDRSIPEIILEYHVVNEDSCLIHAYLNDSSYYYVNVEGYDMNVKPKVKLNDSSLVVNSDRSCDFTVINNEDEKNLSFHFPHPNSGTIKLIYSINSTDIW